MLKAEEQMEIVVLKKHGEPWAVAVHRAVYVRGGEGAKTRKPAPKRAEKLDACKDYMSRGLNRRRQIASPDGSVPRDQGAAMPAARPV